MKVTVDQEEDPVLGRGSQWFGKWIGGEGKQMHVQTALSEGSAVSTQTPTCGRVLPDRPGSQST